MDRNFNEREMNQVINDSMEVNTNLYPYYCRENTECWTAIKRAVSAVKTNKITPEEYWHGNAKEFEWFLVLLSDNYPSKQELLSLMGKGTKDEIKLLADHYYQHINVMFEHVKAHHGYDVLKPSSYMLSLYPGVKDTLYVYMHSEWSHSDLSDINNVVMTLRSNQLNELPKLLKAKLGIIN